jgi:Domain of unknown function (DUF4288)
MNWYLAKIVYRIICGDGQHTPQFDEQLRLVGAADEDEAFYKAQALGEQEEDSFLNIERKKVQWQFINVSELYRISALVDGAELYSRIRETDEAEEYIDLVHRKAALIRDKQTHKLLQLL